MLCPGKQSLVLLCSRSSNAPHTDLFPPSSASTTFSVSQLASCPPPHWQSTGLFSSPGLSPVQNTAAPCLGYSRASQGPAQPHPMLETPPPPLLSSGPSGSSFPAHPSVPWTCQHPAPPEASPPAPGREPGHHQLHKTSLIPPSSSRLSSSQGKYHAFRPPDRKRPAVREDRKSWRSFPQGPSAMLPLRWPSCIYLPGMMGNENAPQGAAVPIHRKTRAQVLGKLLL